VKERRIDRSATARRRTCITSMKEPRLGTRIRPVRRSFTRETTAPQEQVDPPTHRSSFACANANADGRTRLVVVESGYAGAPACGESRLRRPRAR